MIRILYFYIVVLAHLITAEPPTQRTGCFNYYLSLPDVSPGSKSTKPPPALATRGLPESEDPDLPTISSNQNGTTLYKRDPKMVSEAFQV